jgi:hypothetical protein
MKHMIGNEFETKVITDYYTTLNWPIEIKINMNTGREGNESYENDLHRFQSSNSLVNHSKTVLISVNSFHVEYSFAL